MSSTATHNPGNRDLRDFVLSSDLRLRSTGGYTLADQEAFCVPDPWRGAETPESSLLGAVAHVVSVRAREEMAGPQARRIVAPVVDLLAIREQAVSQLPGDMANKAQASVDADLAIPLFGLRSQPQPTRAEFWEMGRDGAVTVDFRPEALGNRPISNGATVAGSGAVPSSAHLDSGWLLGERDAASLTDSQHDRVRGIIPLHRVPPVLGAMSLGCVRPQRGGFFMPIIPQKVLAA